MASSDDQAGSKRPNIVFVLCDNVGWGDFGVYRTGLLRQNTHLYGQYWYLPIVQSAALVRRTGAVGAQSGAGG